VLQWLLTFIVPVRTRGVYQQAASPSAWTQMLGNFAANHMDGEQMREIEFGNGTCQWQLKRGGIARYQLFH